MREAARWSSLVVGLAAATLSLWAVPQGVAASAWANLPASVDTTPDRDTTSTTEPESTTATTEPDDSTPDTSIEDALVGAGNPDSDIDTTTATIAVVGFVALLAMASWWMVRRSDPDAAPMPPQPPSDLV